MLQDAHVILEKMKVILRGATSLPHPLLSGGLRHGMECSEGCFGVCSAVLRRALDCFGGLGGVLWACFRVLWGASEPCFPPPSPISGIYHKCGCASVLGTTAGVVVPWGSPGNY